MRGAMGLKGISSWEKLASETGYSRATLKDLGTTRAEFTQRHVDVITLKLRIPGWFSVPDVIAAVAAAEDEPALPERVEALESKMAALVKRVGGDEYPSPPDDLVSTRPARSPKPQRGPRSSSPPGTDSRTGTDG